MAVIEARGLPQHLSALARANEARYAGAEVKREVAAGRLTVRQALEDERVGSVKVFDLLKAQRRWGDDRARKACAVLRVSEVKRCRELTVRQRDAIAKACEPMPRPETTQTIDVLHALSGERQPIPCLEVADLAGIHGTERLQIVRRALTRLVERGLVWQDGVGDDRTWEITREGWEVLRAHEAA